MFAVKRALKLNKVEATLMAEHSGFRRVVYNMGLAFRMSCYGDVKISDTKFIGEFKKYLTNTIKKLPDFSWMQKMSSRVYQHALRDLQSAYSRYRKGISQHPTFAKKNRGQSFTVDSSCGTVLVSNGNVIKIPTLGTFKLYEPLDESYISQTFHITKEGNKWYVSFCVDTQRLPVKQTKQSVGIDLGIKTFATLSNNEIFDAPKPLKQAKTKLAKLQRKASKQISGGKNQSKSYDKIRNLHNHIKCIRYDFLHKLTTYLAKTFKLIKIEDLNVSGMMANHKLAGAVADLGFYTFRQMLEYKCKMYSANLQFVNQWFPSSKTCSQCNATKDMPLSVRVYDCSNCGMSKDRDLNAAINILNYQPQALRG